MTHVARYAIIRFLPYAETEEFANVGVVMFAVAGAPSAFGTGECHARGDAAGRH